MKELNLAVDPLPVERALGVMWCAESDSFRFRIEVHDRPFSRRGVLSPIGSIYDPNGYLAPVTLKVKQILQQMCKDNLPCSRVSTPTVGKVAARNRTVGETRDTAMFQARQRWPSESSGGPLFLRCFSGRLWSMLLSKID